LTEAEQPDSMPPPPDEAAAQPGAEPLPIEPEGEPPHFPVPAGVADLAPEELSPALAAVCFALNRPVTLGEAAAILGRSQTDVAAAADHLAASLRGGGLMLQRHQEELQLVTRPETVWAVQRALNPEKPGRLSRAALETLAIIAYRQPLTRAGIEAIRGVNCEAVLDSLERRGLIIEVGRQDSPGHPRLFGTTLRFLQVVGLERIEDLPPLPEGLTVPELPGGDWEVEGEAAPRDSAEAPEGESTFEVRGEAVEPVLGGAADPDEGYDFAGEPADDLDIDTAGTAEPGDTLDTSGDGHPHDDGAPPARDDAP